MPEVKETIKTLADSMIARFTPPEFWPGCQVVDVADKDEYTTDNGYIEAIVGPHGQQRVRYQGFPPNAGTSNFFVDVEFFPAYHLYKVFGTGEGGTAKTGGYKVDKVFTPDLSGTVLYSDNGGTVTYPNSDIVMKDSAGTARITLDPGTPSTEAFWEVRDQTGALKLRLSTDNSYRFLVSRGGLDVSQNIFRVDVTGTPQVEWDETNDVFTWNKGHTISSGDIAVAAGGDITLATYSVQHVISHMLSLPGLRGLWPLSSISVGGVAVDISGQSRTLNYNGNPIYNYTGLAPYLAFDGTGDYMSRADEAALDILGTESYIANPGLTLGGWFWFNATGTAEYCLAKDAPAANRSYFLRKGATDQIQVAVSNTGAAIVSAAGGTTLSAQTWYMMVGRWVPSTSISGWVNGIEEATNTTSIPASLFNSTAAFVVGADSNFANLLTGRASLCFLCTSALSDDMIKNLFQQSRALFGV